MPFPRQISTRLPGRSSQSMGSVLASVQGPALPLRRKPPWRYMKKPIRKLNPSHRCTPQHSETTAEPPKPDLAEAHLNEADRLPPIAEPVESGTLPRVRGAGNWARNRRTDPPTATSNQSSGPDKARPRNGQHKHFGAVRKALKVQDEERPNSCRTAQLWDPRSVAASEPAAVVKKETRAYLCT